MKSVDPKSVVDVASGSSEWLSAFQVFGVSDLVAIEAGPANPGEPGSSAAAFHAHDFAQLHRKCGFDVALCLEPAEHLDAATAQALVAGLTRLAPIVVFSAIPYQGVQAQWPSYWAMLFDTRGYQSFLALRYVLWENEDVELRYRQNIICFCDRNRPPLIEKLSRLEKETSVPVDVVHPELHMRISGELARSQRSSGRLEQLAREAATEAYRLKTEVRRLATEDHRLRTELHRLNNYAPLRLYRSFRRVMVGANKTRTEQKPAQERERGDAMTSLAKLIEECPHFHAWPDGKPANWAVAPDVLRSICDQVKPGMQTLETGAGQTTVAFAIAGAQHIAITPDREQIERIQAYLRQSGLENRVAFVQGSSDTVLPSGQNIPQRLDFVFIDGAHRFPFPIIDWYYTAGRVPVGGIVAVDDCRMPSVRILHDFLAAEDDWELVQLLHVTAFFRRVRETTNLWDWADQRINKPHVDMLARQSASNRNDNPIARLWRKLT